MLEESILPILRNKILLMLKLKIIPEEVIKNPTKTPIPSICNLPFPPYPKAMTNSASQRQLNVSKLISPRKIDMDTEIHHPICLHTNA